MQIDELRGELTGLADEIRPFEGDVGALHRRERRHRIVVSSLAAVLVVILGASTVAIVRHGHNGRVNVTAGPGKEVSPDEITHFEAIVVPANPTVKAILDASPLVAEYARMPQGIRGPGSLSDPTTGAALCALQNDAGYAVVGTTRGTNLGAGLASPLSGKATVYDVSDHFGADFEVFLHVGASAARVTSIRTTLQTDPDISSFRYISQNDAYAIFTKDFANQPDLVKTTKPSDLPASFRVLIAPHRSLSAVIGRYSAAVGVDTVVSPRLANLKVFVPPALEGAQAQGRLGDHQAEVFLHVGATQNENESIRQTLAKDPDVTSTEFIDQAHAYAIFKTDFAKQPALVRTTKPADLPVSFRVTLAKAADAQPFAARYQHLDSVMTVITADSAIGDAVSKARTACGTP